MGETFDYVPIQLTRAFREAQNDAKFQGWLKMQEPVIPHCFCPRPPQREQQLE